MPTYRADLVLLRHAINHDWPVAPHVRQSIIDELGAEIGTAGVRRFLAIANTFLAMSEANLRAIVRTMD